jgi:UDP:flavonoid glycosyltransferase YjiC (YdhE family)
LKTHFAYFVTPHGFGHAARAAAVMNAIRSQNAEAVFDIYTLVPQWFFEDSIQGAINYHSLKTDIGLIQSNAMSEDLPATLQALQAFFSDLPDTVKKLAKEMESLRFDAIISDISPLGLKLAAALGIPGYLVENFTWDWIYEYYLESYPEFETYIKIFGQIYQKATFHIQAEPVCQPGPCSFTSRPISRTPCLERQQIRRLLDIPAQKQTVLVTMGGIPTRFQFLEQLSQMKDVIFVIPGSSERVDFHGNLRFLPHHSEFYHPDLMTAADAVLGKSGYSTLAEAYWAGIPFGYFSRFGFRESIPFSGYIRDQLMGIEFSESDFENGRWVNLLSDLLSRPRLPKTGRNGAEETATFILG